MAIEFNCPYCSAMIRVPDSAGGGKGKCPRCARRITVPKVSVKDAPKLDSGDADLFAPPGFDDAAPPEHGAVAAPGFASAAPAVNDDPDAILFAAAEPELDPAAPADLFTPAPRSFGQLPVKPARQLPRPGTIASKLKRKKSGGSWLIPVGCGLVLCGAVGWFLWQQYQVERLSGELTAETASGLELPPAEVNLAMFQQSPDEMTELMAQLERAPVPISSDLMRVQFGATKKAVTVRLNSGPHTEFYRVVTNDDPALAKYRKNHTLNLEESREEALLRAATEFAEEYQRVLNKKSDKSALNPFRNSLALPALVRGLGYHVEAVYGQTAYPCVYEDRDGGLYFLLPPGAKGFEITGRKHHGRVEFSGKYQVKVTGVMKQPPKPKRDPSNKKSNDPDAMDAPGMADTPEDGEMKKNKADMPK